MKITTARSSILTILHDLREETYWARNPGHHMAITEITGRDLHALHSLAAAIGFGSNPLDNIVASWGAAQEAEAEKPPH